MKITFFSAKKYDIDFFNAAKKATDLDFKFIDSRLTEQTGDLARGATAVCCFVNDQLNASVLHKLKDLGVKFVLLRCAGFNNVDLATAKALDIKVARVPEYSPYAVAEHAVAMLLTLNRKIHRAHARIRELNFALDGLVGFDLHGKKVGIIGVGKIGRVFANIMRGFGCEVMAYDPYATDSSADFFKYVSLEELFKKSDIISLHCPLNEQTRHMIDEKAFVQMKDHVYLINTGRGALIETSALIEALKSHKVAGACLDVYEEEDGVFFKDQSLEGINDDILARLTTFPQVLLTSHQAFLTSEALHNIAETTLENFRCLTQQGHCPHQV